MGEEEQRATSLLHDHRIGKLEQSDEKQWGKISSHSDWIHEFRLTLRLVKTGVAALAFLSFAVMIWLRGGWEALGNFLFGR